MWRYLGLASGLALSLAPSSGPFGVGDTLSNFIADFGAIVRSATARSVAYLADLSGLAGSGAAENTAQAVLSFDVAALVALALALAAVSADRLRSAVMVALSAVTFAAAGYSSLPAPTAAADIIPPRLLERISSPSLQGAADLTDIYRLAPDGAAAISSGTLLALLAAGTLLLLAAFRLASGAFIIFPLSLVSAAASADVLTGALTILPTPASTITHQTVGLGATAVSSAIAAYSILMLVRR